MIELKGDVRARLSRRDHRKFCLVTAKRVGYRTLTEIPALDAASPVTGIAEWKISCGGLQHPVLPSLVSDYSDRVCEELVMMG